MTELTHVVTEAAPARIVGLVQSSPSPAEFFAAANSVISDVNSLIPLPQPFAFDSDLDSKAAESDNAVVVYEGIGAMDRSNASDARLWTTAALSTFRHYMGERWPVGVEGENWRRRLTQRWVLSSGSRQSLVRHGIARLWWLADLTYDGDLKSPLGVKRLDQFANTRAAFAKEDRVQSIFEREIGSSPQLVWEILDVLESGDRTDHGARTKTLMKGLRAEAGFREISFLPVDRLRAILVELDGYVE